MITKIQKKEKGKKERKKGSVLFKITLLAWKIIVLRGPFKRKYGSEDVKSNFSSVFAQNCETRHDNAPFT